MFSEYLRRFSWTEEQPRLKELKKENSGQEKQIEKEPGTFQRAVKRKKKK